MWMASAAWMSTVTRGVVALTPKRPFSRVSTSVVPSDSVRPTDLPLIASACRELPAWMSTPVLKVHSPEASYHNRDLSVEPLSTMPPPFAVVSFGSAMTPSSIW